MLVFKIILIDFFENLEKLCSNHKIKNRSEIIEQLLKYKIKINGSQILEVNTESHRAA